MHKYFKVRHPGRDCRDPEAMDGDIETTIGAPASRDGKLELPALNSQAGAWELARLVFLRAFVVNFYVLMVINVYLAVNATPLKQIPSQPYCMKFLMFRWPVPCGSFKTSSR